MDFDVKVTEHWSNGELTSPILSSSNNNNKCVVHNIDLDISEDDFVDQLGSIGCVSAKRFQKKINGLLTPTRTVLLQFDKSPPDRISIFGLFFKTRQYIPLPIQCQNCLKLGHTKNHCTNTMRCPHCGGQHSYVNCPVQKEAVGLKCVNCGDCHSSKFRGCPKYNKVATAIRYSKENNVSYKDALLKTTNANSSAINSTEGVNKHQSNQPIQTNTDKIVKSDAVIEELFSLLRKMCETLVKIAFGVPGDRQKSSALELADEFQRIDKILCEVDETRQLGKPIIDVNPASPENASEVSDNQSDVESDD
jgi:hypothetical protein